MQSIQTGKQTNFGVPFIPPTDQRVVFHSHVAANSRVKDQILRNVEYFKKQPKGIITNRMRELDTEWDVERTLQFIHSSLTIGFMLLGALYNSFYFFLAFCVNVFLLQHSLQGWCPPLPFLRSFGFRTSREINAEREALKIARGDFSGIGDATTVAEKELSQLFEFYSPKYSK